MVEYVPGSIYDQITKEFNKENEEEITMLKAKLKRLKRVELEQKEKEAERKKIEALRKKIELEEKRIALSISMPEKWYEEELKRCDEALFKEVDCVPGCVYQHAYREGWFLAIRIRKTFRIVDLLLDILSEKPIPSSLVMVKLLQIAQVKDVKEETIKQVQKAWESNKLPVIRKKIYQLFFADIKISVTGTKLVEENDKKLNQVIKKYLKLKKNRTKSSNKT